jgi:spore coat polysaccharide biosynthesis protein SpsF
MILAVVQARMSSSRLPGKVMLPLCGKPMLVQQLRRIQRSRRIDGLTVATSRSCDDDIIESTCGEYGINCFRGSLDDVLDRFYHAAFAWKPDHLVRLTGDCPLTDPDLVDVLIDFYQENGFDYASNCHQPTLPDGLDAEIFTMAALETAWREACLPSEREHVTPFLRNHGDRFRCGCWLNDTDLSRHRWTVDEESDYRFVQAVYGALYQDRPTFGYRDVLELIATQPGLARINEGLERNAGAETTRAADRQYFRAK